MIANKDYLLIKAIKKAKCCCNGKDEGGESQVTLKKFAELTIDDINYMMDYPEDLPVYDVMTGFNENDEEIIIDTVGNNVPIHVAFYFSTREKAQRALNYGSYGMGLTGIQGVTSGSTIVGHEVNGTVVYYIMFSPPI